MKILHILFLGILILTSCQDSHQNIFDLDKFPSEWISLTNIDGNLVIFNSCDAGNQLLTLTKTDDNWMLLLHGQQEDYEYNILTSTIFEDTILINAKWAESEELQDFKFVWTDKENGIGHWQTTYYNGFNTDITFVTLQNKEHFRTIDQPCRECWGDECDEFENSTAFDAIKRIFENFIEYQESTDSDENKLLMTESLNSLDYITDSTNLELLINVWMYYDPTDFPSRHLVIKALKSSKPESIDAISWRIKNRKEWETDSSAPYSELKDLKMEIEKN